MTVFKDSIYGVGEVSLMPIFYKRIRRHTESYIINKRNSTQATNKRNGIQATNKRNGTQATSKRCGTQFPLEISVPYCLCKLIYSQQCQHPYYPRKQINLQR